MFFNVEFKEENGLYSIIEKDGKRFDVKCDKLVTVGSKVIVPSMRGPLFPIDDSIHYVSVNELEDNIKSCNYKRYVIMGAGKTGSDAVIELLKNGISQSEITWIISRDVWYVLRDGIFNVDDHWKGGQDLFKSILHGNSVIDVFLSLEKAGSVGRLQPTTNNGASFPNIFRGPTINTDELDLLRSIKDTIRLGRITSITSNEIIFEKGTTTMEMNSTLFVDCMVDKLYGYEDFPDNFKFFEPGRINLGPMLALFNPSLTSAIVAYLEVTFNNDNIKNKFCFPLLGKYGKAIPDTLIGGIYAQSKQMLALSCYKPAIKFVLNSRTHLDAPMHHGGMFKFIWALYGPMQMRKYSIKLIKKVENLSYYGLDHTFGINGRSHNIDPKEIQASLSFNKKKKPLKNKIGIIPLKKKNNSKGFKLCGCCKEY